MDIEKFKKACRMVLADTGVHGMRINKEDIQFILNNLRPDPLAEVSWDQATQMSEILEESIKNLIDDPTETNAVSLIRDIMERTKNGEY